MTAEDKRPERAVVTRIVGGIGNQLFIYAMARQLARRTGAELRLDHTSGFREDFYRRTYVLDRLRVSATFASRRERFDHPGGPLRRKLAVLVNRHRPLERRTYLRYVESRFDPRLTEFEPRAHLTLEGYWQDERYFADAAAVLREEFALAAEPSADSRAVAQAIAAAEYPICLHVRRLHGVPAGGTVAVKNDPWGLPREYYREAVRRICASCPRPHFFGFADQPDWLTQDLVGDHPLTRVTHNRGDERSHEDLWLMSLCRHFILANSSFSWWGAWLAAAPGKVVLAPSPDRMHLTMQWPSTWVQL